MPHGAPRALRLPLLCRSALLASAAALLTFAPQAQAKVTRIVIDQVIEGPTQPPPPGTPVVLSNYETVTGRAFGELDPNDPHNVLITDIGRAPLNSNGKVEYVATFYIVKPKDMSNASGLMWHDVPNRGGRITITTDLQTQGDVGLSSGWQGDNAGATLVPANWDAAGAVTPSSNEWVHTPVLAGTTGRLVGRIVNRSGSNAPLNVMGNPIPYYPANNGDNSDALLIEHLKETVDASVIQEGATIPNTEWKFCYDPADPKLPRATFDSPGSPAPGPANNLPARVCLGKKPDGTQRTFDPAKLYQLTYKVTDPYVLGAGTAAFRDVASFFRYETADSVGTPNPIANKIRWAIIRGSSQSGNFTRHFIFLGMNQGENGRIVHDGAWPLIAGRRVANNSRWGQPDGVLELYQMGSEGPQWWHSFPDRVRDLPPGGILDRCSATDTCPKIIETFGGSEVFALKMTTSWVGTDPKNDIPLPDNVRRYYLPSSTHGGGNGAMTQNSSSTGANCPGNNWGTGTLRANPVPATALVNRMRVALRDWVMHDIQPPPSIWPKMRGPNNERTLVEPTKAAMGFPSGVPGIPDTIFAPENFVFPIFDYDWGPQFDEFNATGVPTNEPPPIKHVIKMLVPKVDSDGNELGGVPTVLRDAPLGTYLGWNITSSGFHAGQVCNYVGGMVPFAVTDAQKLPGDPRPSLQARYGNHDGYVAAVRAAADNAACRGYLLAGPAAAAIGAKCTRAIPAGFPDDWAALVNQAMASDVLK
ncbi:MAG TPA: alpha/beta hydrolase domain-containing protein [Myxococcales bacterium]|nr:alpha/beta hydrolase domain-containing protein [Myxococcales bacterium]